VAAAPDTAFVTVLAACHGASRISSAHGRHPGLRPLDFGTVSADSPTPGVSYTWDIPGVGIVQQQNVVVSNPGEYYVTVTDPTGCTSTATAIVSQDISQPNAEAMGVTLTCTDPQVQISGNSTTQGASLSWSGPGNFTSTLPNPQVTQPGTYTLTVTAPNGCTATAIAMVMQDISLPVITAPPAQKICLGQTATLTATGSNWQAVEWQSPQGILLDSGTVLIVTPVAIGLSTYTVVATAATGCTASATATIEVGPLLNTQIAGPDSVCVGNFALLTASGADTYQWQNGPSDAMITFYPSQGDNTLHLTASNSFGCTQTLTYQLYGKPVVNVNIQGANLLCLGMSDTLSIMQGTSGNTFIWSPGGSPFNYLIIKPPVTTTYRVEAFKAGYCSGKDSITIAVRTLPHANAGANQNVCVDNVILSGNLPPGGSGLWAALDGSAVMDKNAAQTQAIDLASGLNRFAWKIAVSPCPGERSDTVRIFYADQVPQANVDDTLLTDITPISFNVLANDVALPDQPGFTLTLTEKDGEGTWELNTSGILKFEPIDSFSGLATAVYRLCNKICPDICDEAAIRIMLHQPKNDVGETVAITPDATPGKNDFLFFDYLDQYPDNSITIFNRWGQQVYHEKPYPNDDMNGWKGTYNGMPLPAGTYYYILNLSGEDASVWGNVLIVR
jgi:gliding motility-associated-like protein